MNQLDCPSGYRKPTMIECERFVLEDESCPGTNRHAYQWNPNTCASGQSASWCFARPAGCWQDSNGGVFYNEVASGDGTAFASAAVICILGDYFPFILDDLFL